MILGEIPVNWIVGGLIGYFALTQMHWICAVGFLGYAFYQSYEASEIY